MAHIVIADDDVRTRAMLEAALRQEGHDVTTAGDGRAALAHVDAADIMLLDVTMPDMLGWDLLGHVRERRRDLPVIMLSAPSDPGPNGRTSALSVSAVVRKPLDVTVVRARVNAQLSLLGERRREFGELTIDLGLRRVELAGALVHLTPTEFELLVALSDRPGEIVARVDLMARVWDKEYREMSRAVDVMVGTLRRKLGDVARRPRFISTVHGKGYRFVGHLLVGSGAMAAD